MNRSVKSFFLQFLYVYSFSFLYAFFMAYGLGDGEILAANGIRTSIPFFIQSAIWAVLPSIFISVLCILLNPYSLVLEVLLFAICLFICTFTFSEAVLFQSKMDAQSIYITIYSGTGEILTFLKTFTSFELLAILSTTFIIPFFLLKKLRSNRVNWSVKEKVVLLVTTLILLIIPMHRPGLIMEGIHWRGGVDLSSIDRNLRRLFYIEYPSYLPETLTMGQLSSYTPTDVHARHEGKHNVVLVITESTNRHQMSLYGYTRETTPKLDAMKDNLLVYTDVISPSPVTSRSIPHMLTFSNLRGDKQITTVYDVFEATGYDTYTLSGYVGVNYNDITQLIAARAETLFTKKQYDKELFNEALRLIRENTDSKKLIVINTGVAHFPYTPYYPDHYNSDYFQDTPPNLFPNAEFEQRNEYDRAIYYIDTIISEFLTELEGVEDTIVLMTTDHGQEVANYSTSYGHSNSSRFLSCYEIPFYLYMSEDYKDTLEHLVFDVSRPYQTDNLIHSLLDLAKVNTEHFKPELSIFNKAFQEAERLVQGNNYLEHKAVEEKKRSKAFEEQNQ